MATTQTTLPIDSKKDCPCISDLFDQIAKSLTELMDKAEPCWLEAAQVGWFLFDEIIGPYGFLLLKSAITEDDMISPQKFVTVLERTMRIYYLMDSNVERMEEIWSRRQWAQIRYPIFHEAVACYKNGLYYASVSTAVPLVEGILTARSGLEPFSPTKEIKKRAKEIDSSGKLSLVIENLYRDTRSFDSLMEQSINRHRISHGADLTFGTKQKALQMIALLNALVTI